MQQIEGKEDTGATQTNPNLPNNRTIMKSVMMYAFSFCLLIAILAAFDFLFGFYVRPTFDSEVDHSLYEGHELTSDRVVTQTYHFKSGTHTASYTLTKDRYRHTPVPNRETRDRFIALLGCSLIFGTTVEDDETIPAYIGKHQNRYMPYNYGKPGRALQHAYYHLLKSDLSKEIREKEGIAVYMYMGFHFRRIIGGMPSSNISDSLCITLEDGKLAPYDSFREYAPWRWFAYDLLSRTNTPWFLNITFPLNAPQPEHWDLIAALFIESARLFHGHYPNNPFIIAFSADPYDMEEINRRIRTAGAPIESIDLNALIYAKDIEIKLFPDGHRLPETNEEIAKILIEALSLND